MKVVKAGSRPLRDRQGRTEALSRVEILQNKMGSCEKPDPYRVLSQAMETNPVVARMVTAPARVASMIDLFPVFGLKSGRPRRADPEGTNAERVAWSVWRDYVDDCGSQASLIRRHFAAKAAVGSAVQLKFTTSEGRNAYEVVQNNPRVIEKTKAGWVWHPEPGQTIKVDAAREVWQKGFTWPSKPTSGLMPLVDQIALWELVVRALDAGVRSDLLLGGIIAMESSDDDWTVEYVDWIANPPVDGLRTPWPVSYEPGGSPPQWTDGGGTIQDNLIKAHDLFLTNIARFGPLDATMVLEGVGAGTHWNGILMQRDNLQSYIVPELRLEVLDDVVAWPFRPALAESGVIEDPDDWGIDADWQRTINQPDQGKHIIGLVERGILKPRTLTSIGIDEDDLLTPDCPEWEWFERRQAAMKSSKGDDPEGGPGVEVFSDPPDHESDTSTQPNPTQRSGMASDDTWLEFGEW